MATRKVQTRRKRIRRGGVLAVATKATTTKAESKLKDLRNLMIQQESLALKMTNAKADLEKFMMGAKIDKVTLDDIIGEIKSPTPRKQTNIRVADFKKKVSPRDFIACATISVTLAKEVLSGKELAAVSDITAGEKKPAVLTVRMVKPKKG
jgi:hypothetical protein